VGVVNLDDIRANGKDEKTGRFLPGHQVNLKDGSQATHLLEVPEVAAAHKVLVDGLVCDLGGRSEVSAVKLAIVEELAAVQLMTASYRDKLFREGLQTAKGNARGLRDLHRPARSTGQIGRDDRPRARPGEGGELA
jgi:hypothetical protein